MQLLDEFGYRDNDINANLFQDYFNKQRPPSSHGMKSMVISDLWGITHTLTALRSAGFGEAVKKIKRRESYRAIRMKANLAFPNKPHVIDGNTLLKTKSKRYNDKMGKINGTSS
jgi:hypothetical protein